MGTITCKNCQYTFEESDSAWDISRNTGQCVKCGTFFDANLEKQADVLSSDKKLISDYRAIKIWGWICTILAIIMLFFRSYLSSSTGTARVSVGWWSGALIFFSSQAVIAIFYTRRKHARQELRSETDLDKFVK
jgi:hypothetical protein